VVAILNLAGDGAEQPAIAETSTTSKVAIKKAPAILLIFLNLKDIVSLPTIYFIMLLL